MSESLILEVLKQGGFALLSGIVFYVYRKDSLGWAQKQTESAGAFMAFGERTSESMTKLSETMRQQSEILRQIQEQLSRNHLCPVTQVTSDMLRDAIGDGPHRRRMDAVLRAAAEAARSELNSEHPPREGR